MTKLDSMTVTVEAFEDQAPLDQAQLAVVAYLSRYSGRTLDASRPAHRWVRSIGKRAGLTAVHPQCSGRVSY